MRNGYRIAFVVTVAAFAAVSFFTTASMTKAQKKGGFSHATAAHKKQECGSCHKNPTANWVTARGFPDVADFPGHVACFACHKSDFFAGNKPAICAGCHVNPGPRGAGRFPFPASNRQHEFSTIFPHSVHQDIIASNVTRPPVAVAHYVMASFTRTPLPLFDDKPPTFNNCAICHQTRTALPKSVPRIPAAMQPLADPAADDFAPKPGFFRDLPQGHASCFTCHFQGIKPAGTDCASCHKLTTPYTDTNEVKRYSLKFDHQQKDHSARDCMTCHVRISQNADLRTMKDADVPFMACASCHNHGDDLAKEVAKRNETAAAKQPAFQCTYCHTPAIGRFPVPASHQGR